MAGQGLTYVIETARRVWNMKPHLDVRIPPALDSDREPIPIDALWTDYALRPNVKNLAFIVQSVSQANIEQWKQRLSLYPIRAGLLVSDEVYILQYQDTSGRFEQREIEPDSLAVELAEPRSKLFSPKALAEFRTGQLTLADLEESLTARSLSFLLRQRAELDRAFQTAIKGVLEYVGLPNQQTNPQSYLSSRTEIAGHGIRVAIAFMAARILQDKGFFGSDSIPTNDPQALLHLTVPRANGFFRKALEESIPNLTDQVLQHLGAHLGSQVSFALVDHRDVGLLYERAIKELPDYVSGKKWTDLQRHYTPVAIAERMLELLPLEKLRPEERVIFDPAAGSGSLLLAATSRLAGMSDIPVDIENRGLYLAQHVAGNDLDQYADLVTQLRYTLARESLGQDVPFPFPSHFSHEDYENLTKENIGIKPRVIVANPPFAEDGNTQRAVTFIEKVLSWLDKDSQFAFILPQSFLTASTHGIPNVRSLLAEKCHIFEVWQCPEKTVGIDAEQDVCIVLGSIGKPRIITPTTARAVFSRVKDSVSNIRDNGFLGKTWLTRFNSYNWNSVTAPPVSIKVPTILLGKLFYVFNGVNPGTPGRQYKPIKECPPGVECKLHWGLRWRNSNTLWADPNRVPEDKRWIRYGREYLEGPRLENAQLFDLPKILVGRKVNRGSSYPLASQLDTTGLCPDNNIFCVLPAKQVGKYVSGYENTETFEEWDKLNYEEQRLWLLGILVSRIANALSLIGRKTHEITTDELCKLQLPKTIDLRIIEITRQIVERDKNNLPITQPNKLREQLDILVEESYGNPSWIEIARTGIPPELEDWKSELTKSTFIVRGQILEISEDNSQMRLYLSGLMDDNREEWLPILPEIPGWALDGTVFEAELSEDVETFAELAQRPWAIRRFRHTPRPYLTDEELTEELGIET
ncbi:hypothetical protein NIES2109_07810 [Nostoc sp. HK-01]|nr:hypothetical protein NIES2109_07810 [Nostoc sp. HK-01]